MTQHIDLYMPQEKPVPFRYPRSLFSRLAGVAVLWASWAAGVVGALLGVAMMSSYNWRGFGVIVLFGAAFFSLRLLGQHMRGFRDLRIVQSKPTKARAAVRESRKTPAQTNQD